MKKLITHLWFDTEAREAANWYVSLFDNSHMGHSVILEDTPSGDAELISFTVAGQELQAINGGPVFTFNPSFSFMVACESEQELRTLHSALSDGGVELMPLGEYPFSSLYCWVQDRYGLSWQLMLTDEPGLQKITPSLLFSQQVCGKAAEAARFYTEIFKNTAIMQESTFKDGEAPNKLAKTAYLRFQLDNSQFVASDNGNEADFTFNESVSFIINCRDQQEIDYFWNHLSAVPESEQCGWVKDAYGVSWQIVPDSMDELFTATPDEKERMTRAILQMKKIDIAELEAAKKG